VHAAVDIEDLAGISCFVAGTLCPSPSKARGAATLGEDGLAAIVRCARPLPVLAIGGVSPAMVSVLIGAGAAGAAAIGAFLPEWPGDDPAAAVQRAALAFRAAASGAVAATAAGGTN
jgi:thiamine monophosphate synthase